MTIGSEDKRIDSLLEDPLLPRRRRSTSRVDVEFEQGASFPGAVFNLSTTIVGAGIMALPAAMKVLGLLPGILTVIFFAFLTDTSIQMMVRFSRTRAGDGGRMITTYAALMDHAFGGCGRVLLQICVIVNNIGILTVYMIISGDVISGTSSSGGVESDHHSGLLETWFGVHWWTGRAFILLVTTILVFAPLATLKRIDSLKFTSGLSVALAVVFVVVTAAIAIAKLFNGSILMPRLFPNLTDLASIWNLFTVVPVIVTAYVCHYNVHTINNELEDSSQILPVVRTSLGLCSTVYIATSLFALLLFGESTLDDVLANFDSDLGIPYSNLFNVVVRLSYVVHLIFVFPIVFFALRLNTDGLLFPSAKPLSSDNRRFSFVTVLLLCLIYGMANFIPSIWDAFQFSGATAAVCIGFIFPAAITLRDRPGIATKWDTIMSVIMIILAVLSNAVAIYSDASSIFSRRSVPSPRS